MPRNGYVPTVPRVLALALLVLALPSAAGAQVPLTRITTGPGETGDKYTGLEASSRDGTRMVFASHEDLSPDDDQPLYDFYARTGDELRVLTRYTGTLPKHEFPLSAVSADARTIVFRTAARWTADDGDEVFDVFRARDGVVERVSIGNTADFGADFAGLSGDGGRVLFTTAENIVDDTDYKATDAFAWEGGVVTRLSKAATATGGNDDRFQTGLTVEGHSADARRVVLRTVEPLTTDDRDERFDLFLHDGAGMRKLSPGDGAHDAHFDAISADGAVIVFHTTERLLATDTDDRSDVYRVAGGVLSHVSPGNSNEAQLDDEVLHLTADGSQLLYASYDRVTADDTDGQLDTFLWSGGTVRKVCPGNGEFEPTTRYNLSCLVVGGADDLSSLVVSTREHLTADDTDGHIDLFDIRNGSVTRLTTGPRGGNDDVDVACPFEDVCMTPSFVSSDGGRVIFETEERLVEADTDTLTDVYFRGNGVTTLLSAHRTGPEYPVAFHDAGDDGAIAYLQTPEQLTDDDRNLRSDGFRLFAPAGTPPAGGLGVAGESTTTAEQGAATTPAGQTPGPTAGTAKPAARLRLLPGSRKLRLTRRAPRVVRKGRGVRFSLDRRAPVIVEIERLLPGRRSGLRCVAPTPRLRTARPCARPRPVTRPLRVRLGAGRHVLQVGGRRARPGRYAISLSPVGGRPVRVEVRYLRAR